MRIIIEADPGLSGEAMANHIRHQIANVHFIVPTSVIEVVHPTASRPTANIINRSSLEVDSGEAVASLERFTEAAKKAKAAAAELRNLFVPRPFFS